MKTSVPVRLATKNGQKVPQPCRAADRSNPNGHFTFIGCEELPRELRIRRLGGASVNVSACVCSQGTPCRENRADIVLAMSRDSIENCRITVSGKARPVLWVGKVGFPLTTGEVKQISTLLQIVVVARAYNEEVAS